MKNNRIGEINYNNQGCLMKIIEYNNSENILIEFQDKHKAKVHTKYQMFLNGKVKNPYFPEVFNVGIIGGKYPISINGKCVKEYIAWQGLLRRCFDEKLKEKYKTYKNVSCCDEWLLYENFYEWIHSQENFDKWLNGNNWDVDKDILFKGNKVYSPDTCCLVPQNINKLFNKHNTSRGDLPIGVTKSLNKFRAYCKNPFENKVIYLGTYLTVKEAFDVYKDYKEKIIRQMAEIEYNKNNITKQCYISMINYQVEIID